MSRELASRHSLDLVVWPESVLDLSLLDRKGRLPPDLTGGTGVPTLFGAVLWLGKGSDRRVYGSAVLVDGAGRILGTYDKSILMPFGEYIPFGDTFPWLYSWSPHSGRFWPGTNEEPLAFRGHLLSVNICYEDIFPAYVRKLMRGGPDRRIPNAIFNLTNDSWYGNSVEPTEHLVLASFRAIEHRRALVRATNTGISAIVDPVGRLDRRTGQWTRETLVGSVPMMHGRTVYAVLGDWVGWVCVALSLLGLGRAARAARRGAIGAG
jgi:apolipoprotein N-acyltransferase